MTRNVDIFPAVIRDASWITANMRELDRREAFCQMRDDVKTHELAYWSIHNSDAYVAYWRDKPTMLFGTAVANICCLSVWAFGTADTWRVASAVTRFMRHTHLPARAAAGYTSMEARSLVEHETAHRWIRDTGGVQHGPPFVYGKGGEEFILFRWTADALHGIQAPHREETAA